MQRHLLLIPLYLLTATLPLLTAVGPNLEYEYALICSYLALLLIPALGLALPASWLPRDEHGAYAPAYAIEVFWIFLISPLVALVPGMVLHAVQRCQCSTTGFGFWMLILWYPAWVLAHALHHAILRARTLGVTRWQAGATLTVCYAAVLAAVTATLWLSPQKRLVDPVAGFLHGPIYDAWIAVDNGVPLARASHLALATALLALTWFRRRIVFGLALAVAVAAWLGTGLLAARVPSVQNGKAQLDALLDRTLTGPGFTLHYQAEGKGESVPLPIQRLFRDTEFQIGELTGILATGGQPLPHVQVYIYPDEDRKKLWFGGGSTDVTDVRTPSIHIAETAWPHPTLRHELVHALASGFGYHGLGFHPNLAFTEGLAVALAPAPGSLSLDDGAASLLQSGRLRHVETLFTPFFWHESGSRAYTVAGSFIRHLIDHHGIAGVKALYAGTSWEEAFGHSRTDLIKEWEDRILAGYNQDRERLYTEALFRYPGILNDLCPHSKADLARGRGDSFYTRARQPLGWDPDADYLAWRLRLDPKDEATQLTQWRQEIRRIATDRFAPAERLRTWREALAKARAFPPKTLEDVDLAILEADVARILGDGDGGARILTDLAAASEQHAFGDGATREIQARLGIEAAGLPQATVLDWRRYLAGWRKLPDVSLADTHGAPWLLTYLKLRNEREVPLKAGDLIRLLGEAPPPPQLPATFRHEWYKLIAGRLMQLEAYQEAAAAFAKASEAATAGTREVYAEHARRAQFYAARGPLAPPPELVRSGSIP